MAGSATFFSDWQLYNFYCSPSDYTQTTLGKLWSASQWTRDAGLSIRRQ